MKNQLFDKIICFTDIHFGARGNSKLHNEDCTRFVNWVCDLAAERGIKYGAFLGDWHHHRNTVNVSTLNYTVENLEKLNSSFEKFFLITGNHDLYYREKREISSLPMGRNLQNLILVDQPFTEGNVTFLPWLVGDEWKDVTKLKSKYMFGHFEIPGFKMNAMVEMPDHGTLNKTHFKNQDYVFSGHFHKRQQSGNVHYIGNPFGHNYADAWDFDRGCMILEWGGEPEYVNWAHGPKYVTTQLSKIVEDPESFLFKDSYVRATIDVDLTYEEVNYLKEALVDQYQLREFKLVHEKDNSFEEETDADITFETVDSIVMEQLNSIESESFDKTELMKIYNSL